MNESGLADLRDTYKDMPIKGTCLDIQIRTDLGKKSFKERRLAMKKLKENFPVLAKQGVFNMLCLLDKGNVDLTMGDCAMSCEEFLENLCEVNGIELRDTLLFHKAQKGVTSMLNIEKLCRDYLSPEFEFEMKLGRDSARLRGLTTEPIEKFYNRIVKLYTGTKPY